MGTSQKLTTNTGFKNDWLDKDIPVSSTLHKQYASYWHADAVLSSLETRLLKPCIGNVFLWDMLSCSSEFKDCNVA